MKNLNSKAKITILINFFLILSTYCQAQKIIFDLKDDETAKAITQFYKAKKLARYISVENINNKFINVNQNSPNLPINLRPSKFDIIFDKNQLTKICAKYIELEQMQEMLSRDSYGGLMISLRTDIYGKILEVFFSTEQTSMLSLTQIEQIENEIKKTNLVTIKPEMLRYLQGSNFWLLDPKIYYEDLLKVKLEMERSKRPTRGEIN